MKTPIEQVLESFDDVTLEHLIPMFSVLLVIGLLRPWRFRERPSWVWTPRRTPVQKDKLRAKLERMGIADENAEQHLNSGWRRVDNETNER